MVATDGEHAIQIPDTPAATTGEHCIQDPTATEGEHGVQEKTAKKEVGCCCRSVVLLALAVVLAFFITLAVLHAKDEKRDPPAVYSAAVAGLHGLDAAAPRVFAVAGGGGGGGASLLAVPALFNLTVHIKNPSQVRKACVANGSVAAVAYGGAPVAAGAVPPFCAGETEEREVVVPVWGIGVDVPDALRRREAAAAVDVAILPRCELDNCEWLLACSVEVGGGLSVCTDYNAR